MHIKNVYNSTVARVIASSSPAYAGPDNSYVKLGGVYKNEFVAILSVNGKWAYCEYNTKGGRKRGYIKNIQILTIMSLKVMLQIKHIFH